MARPNLTSVKIRYKDPLRWIIGRVDPAYGVPEQNVPMAWDVNRLMYRPFSSILAADLADAVANFAGWSDGFVQPQPNEEAVYVTIVTEGIVEVLLDTATAIHTQTLLAPTAGTVLSNDTFADTAVAAEAIMKVIKTCNCSEPFMNPCPPDVAAATLIAAAETGSPSDLAVYGDRRTAWAYFNVAYTSGA
jgi:hypothetical protein